LVIVVKHWLGVCIVDVMGISFVVVVVLVVNILVVVVFLVVVVVVMTIFNFLVKQRKYEFNYSNNF
jgi:hypothetical protein